jgi:hypothetical protein
MSYLQAIEEWAVKSEMPDAFKVGDDGVGNAAFNMTFGEYQAPVMLRGFDDHEMLSLFIFLPFEAKKEFFLEVLQAFNVIHETVAYGRFTLSETGEINFNQNITFGQLTPDASVIELMVSKAFITLDFHMEGIALLANGKSSFAEWKERLPESSD